MSVSLAREAEVREGDASQSRDRHIPELDGIRGLAIILVLLYHFGNFTPRTGLDWTVWQIFGAGWSGVDLFFVLSGFLITSILLRTKESPRYFQFFYARRVLRIFPLYFVYVFIAFQIALPLAHYAGQWLQYSSSGQIWYWLYLANFPLGQGTTVAPVSHLWSLSIEEQFYLVWPLVVLCAKRSTLLRICVGMVAVSLILRFAFSSDVTLIYYLTPFRLDGLALGAAIAVGRGTGAGARMYAYSNAVIAIAAGTLLGVFLFARSTFPLASPTNTIGYTMLSLCYAGLVLRCVERTGTRDWLCRTVRVSALRKVGKYSYGMYVLHVPVLLGIQALSRRYLQGWFGEQHVVWLVLLELIVGSAAVYACALVSWNLLEQPFLRLKEKFAYANGGASGASAAA